MQAVDIPAVAAAHLAAWQKAFRGILSDRFLDELTEHQFEETWSESFKRPSRENLVVDSEQGVIGFIAFGPSRDDGEAGEIHGIYVHPNFWRTGAGSLLLTSSIDRLKSLGLQQAIVWTMTKNSISHRFYEQHGLSPTGKKRISKRQNETFEEIEYRIV